MEKSKALARANWKGSGDKSVDEKWFKIREELKPTEFLGYEFEKAEGVVLKFLKIINLLIRQMKAIKLILLQIKHLFMAESGGQVGDQGIIFNSDCKIDITDTQKKWEIFLFILEN